MYKDWILKGIAKPGKTKKGLAAAINAPASAVTGILNGTRAIKAAELGPMSDYLGEPLPRVESLQSNAIYQPDQTNSKLIRSANIDATPTLVAIYASAEDGEGVLVLSSEPVDFARPPSYMANEDSLYGVVVEGESMSRAYRPGDTIWINPNQRERRDEPCLFRRHDEATGEAKAMIRWLVSYTTDKWFVETLNPVAQHEVSRKDWPDCYRILGKKNRP